MALSKLGKRSLATFGAVSALVILYWFFFTSSNSQAFTPEQINDMFQNKASEIKVKKIELPSHAISSPYLDKQTLKSPNWDFFGDIIVENGKHISLTSDKKHQASVMFAKTPLKAQSFEMELTFHMHGIDNINADGMAIWFVDKPSDVGEVFGSQNDFTGMGVIIDTFRNGKRGNFPYVNAQYSTAQHHYTKFDDGLDSALAGCTAKSLLNPISKKSRMRIIHTRNGYFSVDFNYNPDHSDTWVNCFTVMDVHLPQELYLGISAETGELTENVDIIESRIFALYSPDGNHYIDSVDELEEILEKQAPPEGPEGKKEKKRRRRSALRLRNAERRIKKQEREYRLQKYGDPDATFLRRWARRVVKAIKVLLYTTLLVVFGWIVRIVIKTKRSSRGYKKSGLLD